MIYGMIYVNDPGLKSTAALKMLLKCSRNKQVS